MRDRCPPTSASGRSLSVGARVRVALLAGALLAGAASRGVAAAPAAEGLAVEVVGDQVALREAPGADATLRARLWSGLRLRAVELRGGYVRVVAPTGSEGWVEGGALRSSEPVSVPDPTRPGPAAPGQAATRPAVTRPDGDGDRAGPGGPAPAIVGTVATARSGYLLQRGDEVRVQSVRHKVLDDVVRIRPDGYLSLVLLDDVFAEGLTLEELEGRLREGYAGHYRDAGLTVSLEQSMAIAHRRIFVGGEVESPGELRAPALGTPMQMIIAAGGFRDTADASRVLLLRHRGAETVRRILDLSEIDGELAGPDDVVLESQDVLYVPPTLIAEVGEAVDQYFDNVIPDLFSTGFSWLFAL